MRSASPNQQRDPTGHISGDVTKMARTSLGYHCTEQQSSLRLKLSFCGTDYSFATRVRQEFPTYFHRIPSLDSGSATCWLGYQMSQYIQSAETVPSFAKCWILFTF